MYERGVCERKRVCKNGVCERKRERMWKTRVCVRECVYMCARKKRDCARNE